MSLYDPVLKFPLHLFRLLPEDGTPVKAEIQLRPEISNRIGIKVEAGIPEQISNQKIPHFCQRIIEHLQK